MQILQVQVCQDPVELVLEVDWEQEVVEVMPRHTIGVLGLAFDGIKGSLHLVKVVFLIPVGIAWV